MNDQAKFQRMLEILMKLSGSYGYSVKQLAEDFESSERTIYRYLTTFKNAGFLLDNHNGYFKIDKKSPDYKDLSKLIHFSEEEAHVLSKAIHLIDDESKFQNDLYEKLYVLFDSDKAVNKIVRKESSENVISLKGAIKNKEQVIFHGYRSSNSDNIRDRLLEPFAFTSNYNYVWCYDIEAKSSKTFKVARIKEVKITDKKWKNEKLHKRNEIDVFRIGGEKTIPVKLTLSLMVEEDKITDFLETILNARLSAWQMEWHSQARLGTTGEDTNQLARADLSTKIGNTTIVAEALRIYSYKNLTSQKKNIEDHILKTFNQTSTRKYFYNLIYYQGDDFNTDWDSLKTIISSTSFPNGYAFTSSLEEETELSTSDLKVCKTKHENEVICYHIFVNVVYKT